MTGLTEATRNTLMALCGQADATTIELPILHHADIFVDLIGEDIRRRLYVAPGNNGETMALRPEFTIPSCLHHLQTGPAERAACYAYMGPVFRQREDNQAGEFYQAGIERIDPQGGVGFDAQSVAHAYRAVEQLSGNKPAITMGDRALFSQLLSSLGAPSVWQRRLEGAFGDRKVLDRMLERLAADGSEHHGAAVGLAKVLEDKDTDDVRAAVEEMLQIAGLSAVGGRSVGDIAERYMEKAELAAKAGWDGEKLAIIRQYLDISGSAKDAINQLQAFDARHGGLLGDALTTMIERNDAIAKEIGDGADLYFNADFGRRLDYYSGFNFELFIEGQEKSVAGGGRYDRLLGLLAEKVEGAQSVHSVPAIGFSIWLDRVQQ